MSISGEIDNKFPLSLLSRNSFFLPYVMIIFIIRQFFINTLSLLYFDINFIVICKYKTKINEKYYLLRTLSHKANFIIRLRKFNIF